VPIIGSLDVTGVWVAVHRHHHQPNVATLAGPLIEGIDGGIYPVREHLARMPILFGPPGTEVRDLGDLVVGRMGSE
jgi:hypothetical protein